jgi:retinol dehydrogenase-12
MHVSPVSIAAATALALALTKKYCAGGVNHHTPNLAGKYIVITGANTGIGLQTAIVLARLGATVTIACRDSAKTQDALTTIRQTSGNNNVYAESIDLADLASVKAFAQRYNNSGKPLHVLINNAGVFIYGDEQKKTVDGHEMHWGVNFLALAQLTHDLLPVLKQSAPARIVNLTSDAHTTTTMQFGDVNHDHEYTAFRAYAHSKLAILLYSNELNRRLIGTGVTVNAVHPGGVRSEMLRHFPPWLNFVAFQLGYPLAWLMMKSPLQGAQTTLHVTLAPECGIMGGRYWADCAIRKSSNKQVGDLAVERKVFELVEDVRKI